jgi:hypothetical protein
MRRVICVVFLVYLQLSVFAQLPVEEKYLFSSSDVISLNAGYYTNSNTINNYFLNQFFTGGFIDETTINNQSDLLENTVKIGFRQNFNLAALFHLNNQWAINFGLKTDEFLDASFNKSAFDFVFKGNVGMLGNSINLAPMRFEYFTYESFYSGLSYKNNKISVYGNLSYLKGSRYQQFIFNQATFYTASNADTISFNGNADLTYVDDGIPRLPAFFGSGASIDLALLYQPTAKISFFSYLQDVGFMRWKKMNNLIINNDYLFTGIETQSLLNTDTLFSTGRFDSIPNLLGVELKKINPLYYLPISYYFSAQYEINNTLNVKTAFQYLSTPHFKPRFYALAEYLIGQNWRLSPCLAYGGYGGFDYGLGIEYALKQKYFFKLNNFFLEDLISPVKSKGQGINFLVCVLLN